MGLLKKANEASIFDDNKTDLVNDIFQIAMF
jgi:hypothetical protein